MKYYLGVDLGGTNIAAGVVDENFQIIAKDSMPTKAGRSMESIIGDVVKTAEMAAADAGISLRQFTSLGIGMPSCVNPKTHLLVHANNLDWKNVPIYDCFKAHIKLPLFIENDANCAVLGETLAGNAKSCENVVMLTLGTGVGGGIILNKRIYAGADMLGAELGHVKLVYNGIRCSCGQKGCLESYCSATALIEQTKESMKTERTSLLWDMCHGSFQGLDGRLIFEAAANGDATAKNAVAQYTDYLAAGISTFITIFRPEVIILGGGIAEAGSTLLDTLNRKVRAVTFAADEIGVPPVVKAALGNDAGIIGAALLERYTEKR
ncbi:ROK family protein [Hungatella hathewayi]|uniref:ROK family protein n=1 Tax=Hungatella hathewayi TaxID=154046 RepID=UPI00356A0C3C